MGSRTERPSENVGSQNNGIIGNIRYVRNTHEAPNFDLIRRDQLKVVGKYESLDDTEKARIPAASYDRAKAAQSWREAEGMNQKI